MIILFYGVCARSALASTSVQVKIPAKSLYSAVLLVEKSSDQTYLLPRDGKFRSNLFQKTDFWKLYSIDKLERFITADFIWCSLTRDSLQRQRM